MQARVITASKAQRMRWKNDRGWTTELALAPADASLASGFDWRVSIAEVESDCEFSPFHGVDRTLMLLEGHGMELTFDRGDEVPIELRGHPITFSGDAKTQCRLYQGPCRDFNLMAAAGRYKTRVLLRPLVGPMVFFPEPEVTWVIHQLAGRSEVRNLKLVDELDEGDTLVIEQGTHDDRVVLDGGGELVVVRLERRPSP